MMTAAKTASAPLAHATSGTDLLLDAPAVDYAADYAGAAT